MITPAFTERKAAAMSDALVQAANEYDREGNGTVRDLLITANNELPAASKARLYDILRQRG